MDEGDPLQRTTIIIIIIIINPIVDDT